MSGGYIFTLARRAGFIGTSSGVPMEFLTVSPAGARLYCITSGYAE
jgi:hypothetical protein